MLMHSEKAISLWKTVCLASVLSNASHLRFWELSAWLCAWLLILAKEKWKFKALQELLLAVERTWELAGTGGQQGTKGPDPAAHQARGAPCVTLWPRSVTDCQADGKENTANCSHPARPDACEVCNGKVTWRSVVPSISTGNQGMAGSTVRWESGLWGSEPLSSTL